MQDGFTSDMMFEIPVLVEHISSVMSLEASLFIYFASSTLWVSLSTMLLTHTVLMFAFDFTSAGSIANCPLLPGR